MQLSAKTIAILKNFATINPSIVLKPGHVISTISPNKTIMARAVVPDEFAGTYGIYSVNQFIGANSLFENPEVEFGENSVRFVSGGNSTNLQYCEPATILVPPDKEIKLPSVDVDIKLTNKNIQDVLKGLGVFGLPDIAVVGDGKNISLQALDSKGGTSNSYKIVVGETGLTFRAIFRPENMKMIDGDYEVKISSRGISQFVGLEATYWIAVESSSSF